MTAPLDFKYEQVRGVNLEVGSDKMTELRTLDLEPASLRGAAVGDFNGDSKPDAAFARLRNGASKGEVFLAFGDGARGRELSLDALHPPEGAALVFSDGKSGTTLASGGDFNSDGKDDLILRVSINKGGGNSVEEWLLVAGRDSFAEGTPIDALEKTTRIFSSSNEVQFTGASAIVPDVNGDRIDDLLLSSARQEGRTLLYIVTGSKAWPSEAIDLETLAEDGLGARLEVALNVERIAGSLGDFNGDRANDVFFSGRGVRQEGAMVIVYGGPAIFTGDTFPLTTGFFGDNGGLLVAGPSLYSGIASGAAGAGDIDGDGDQDVFFYIDSYGACTLAPRAGGGAIFDYAAALSGGVPTGYGDHLRDLYASKPTGLPDFMPAGPGVQSGVFYLEGSVALEGLGSTAAPAGDFDGDGIADLLVGAPGVSSNDANAGACYILRGKRGLLLLDEDIARFPGLGEQGLRFSATPAGSRLGKFVQGGFDWDKDGLGDVLVAGDDGRAFVVFGVGSESTFIRGDADADGQPRLTDAVVTLLYLFQGGLALPCLDAADSNDDGIVNIADPIYTLSYLFLGGPAPPAPFPQPGSDLTGDALGCFR